MTLTAEDRLRAEQYAAERRRREAADVLGGGAGGAGPGKGTGTDPASLAAYLSSLELCATVRRLAAGDVARAAQLTQKTNQFNLTTRRRTEAEVEALRNDPGFRLYVLEVSDRFGDYGLTGLLFVCSGSGEGDGSFAIDTLLLSCRVLGRGVETALLKAAVDDLMAGGATRLSGRFVPSAKNAPASGFFLAHGFRQLDAPSFVDSGDAGPGAADWELLLSAATSSAFALPHVAVKAGGQDLGSQEPS
jgi:predicted enzyme involved in methoxymalonyl-ACP biosynthesis